jgi:aminoglycoside phosphotransferase (APT) family kinase protein
MDDPLAAPPPDETSNAGLLEAAAAFFPEIADARPLAGRDHLLLVETPVGRKIVRRWPADAPDARVAATVALLGRLAAAGVPAPRTEALPDGGGVLRLGGDRYDARSWLPGSPFGRAAVAYPDPERWLGLPVALPEGAFADAIRALARLHQETTAPAGPLATALPAAPLAALPAAVQTAWMETRAALRPVAPRTPAVQRWLAAGERLLPAAEAALAAADPSLLAASAVVHQNAWPSHVLVGEGEAVTGLLGWERAAFGTPLLDLAQAVVRLRGWSVAAVEEMVAARGDVAPLAPELRRLLPAVAGLDLVATAGRLLAATYAPGPNAPAPPSALRQAATRLVEAMENATGSLAQAEAKSGTTRKARPWRRPAQGPKGRRR